MQALTADEASPALARRALVISTLLTLPGFALGLIAMRTGAVAGIELGLVLSGLVFATSALIVLLAVRRVPLQTVATTATIFFGFYLCAGAGLAAVGVSPQASLFIYLVWLFPLLVFNRLVNTPNAGRILGYVLRIVPLLFLAGLIPRLIPLLDAGQRYLLITLALSYVAFGAMLTTVSRYREEYIVERERAEMLKVEAAVLESISDCFISLDSDLRLVYLNDAACNEFRVARSAALLHSIQTVAPNFFSRSMLTELEAATGNDVASMFEAQDEGRDHWYSLRCFPRVGGMSVYFHNITDRKVAEEKIERLAFYDALTDLPNRRLLRERLERALATAARAKKMGALLFIDVDDFKTLNDTLGHEIGDDFLRQVAVRIRDCVRNIDTVARLGGDEFVVLLEGLNRNEPTAAFEAKVVGEKILRAFWQPYQFGDFEHLSTASIGVTLFPSACDTTDELLKRADLAMYQAKAEGRNAVRFFDLGMETLVASRAALRTDLRRAMQDREFELYYQPLVEADGHVVGAEALLRWHHPQRGIVPPAEFIPVAEEAGLIVELGRWILEDACAQLAAWARQPRLAHLEIAVNVSLRQFVDAGFIALVRDVLTASRADPGQLKLEITESSVMESVDGTIAIMSALKAINVTFALDDFGTGYSSLSHLKRLPLDRLKIDKSFVCDVLTSGKDAAIVRNILALGQSLDLTVIAEGVETEGQRAFLEHEGCQLFQGYLFSRALPPADFETYVKSSPIVAS